MLLTFRKIPEPMIEPTTSVTASNGPRTRGRTSIGLRIGRRRVATWRQDSGRLVEGRMSNVQSVQVGSGPFDI